jgi:hypothetical protein
MPPRTQDQFPDRASRDQERDYDRVARRALRRLSPARVRKDSTIIYSTNVEKVRRLVANPWDDPKMARRGVSAIYSLGGIG